MSIGIATSGFWNNINVTGGGVLPSVPVDALVGTITTTVIEGTITSTSIVGVIDGCEVGDIIEVARGEDRTLQLTIKDAAGAVVDITGATVTFTVRRRPQDPVLIEKDNSGLGGVTLVDAANGRADIDIQDTDTGPLNVSDYKYDVFLQQADTTRTQVIEPSIFRITSRITVLS